MGEVGAAYAECRARITKLTGQLDEHQAAIAVPACPEWSVHDVVAHVSGVVDDVLAGRLDGVATDPWTATQVEARRSRSIAEILAEWDANAPAIEALLDKAGPMGRQAVADIVTHEHDVRGALGAPGARDSGAVQVGLGFVAAGFVRSAAASHGFALRVRTTDGLELCGESGVVITGEPFELLRAMTGRRSLDQLRNLEWDADPDAYLAAFTFGAFHPAPHPIIE